MKKTNEEGKDVYSIVTDQIIAALERGVIPWRKPWQTAGSSADPRNGRTGRQYRGVNWFLLQLAPFDCNRWVTFKQAGEMGGTIRKGEKSSLVTFWKMLDGTDKETGEEKKIPMLRYYRVFNLTQCEGIELPADQKPILAEHERIAAAEAIVAGMPQRPPLRHTGGRAYYTPALDSVTMPELGRFHSAEEYYSTLFHELTHATGHASRLGRIKETASFGSDPYAREELVAEMGAAYLCARAGIAQPILENSAAYIQNWLKRLKDDRKLIVTAAAQAAKAADFIAGPMPEPDPAPADPEPTTTAADPDPVPAPAPEATPTTAGQLSLF